MTFWDWTATNPFLFFIALAIICYTLLAIVRAISGWHRNEND